MLLAPRYSNIRMSLEAPHPGHHTEDWSRSSFFDFNSEMVKDLDLESDEESDNESATEPTFYSVNAIDIDTDCSDNPFMNELMQNMVDRFAELIDTGELPPTFMDKMRVNPEEIKSFIQENHTTIGNELNDRLDPEIRPSLHQMVESGYIPNTYYPFIELDENEEEIKNDEEPINDEEHKNDAEPENDEDFKKEIHLNDDIKTEQIIINSDGEKSKESENIKIRTEAAYIEELKSLNQNKDEKIEKLMAEIAALKEREKNIESKPIHRFSVSHTKIISVENEIKSKHVGEIEAVKTEYSKLLDDMQRKHDELEQKHLDSMTALQDAERSKVELLRCFNGEMDRMRSEIKKFNSIKIMAPRRVNV